MVNLLKWIANIHAIRLIHHNDAGDVRQTGKYPRHQINWQVARPPFGNSQFTGRHVPNLSIGRFPNLSVGKFPIYLLASFQFICWQATSLYMLAWQVARLSCKRKLPTYLLASCQVICWQVARYLLASLQVIYRQVNRLSVASCQLISGKLPVYLL